MRHLYRILLFALVPGVGACAMTSARTPAPPTFYTAYVANEASDIVTRLVFTPGRGLAAERRIIMGSPGRIDGPHGIAAATDGRHWFVALAHGVPTGRVAKYTVDGDTVVSRVAVGLFPESLALTPDGQYLFVSNSNRRGAGSGVSVVHAKTMTEVARPQTCVQPTSGVVDPSGRRHYSVCAASDQLVEIDAHSFQVTRRFSLAPGREAPLPTDAREPLRRPGRRGCTPAAVTAGHGARAGMVYAACSGSGTVLEIDVQSWNVTRRFEVAGSPSALHSDATASLLFVALAEDSAVAVLDLGAGSERARIRTSQASPAGLALTADSRYLFVTNEGAGPARGTVDVIDTATLQRVASIAVEYSPGGIALLPR